MVVRLRSTSVSFVVTHLLGNMEPDPEQDWIGPLISELNQADQEHPDVAVTHESGWSLSGLATGLVIFENVESDDAPLSSELTRQQLAEAFAALAAGDVVSVVALLEPRS